MLRWSSPKSELGRLQQRLAPLSSRRGRDGPQRPQVAPGFRVKEEGGHRWAGTPDPPSVPESALPTLCAEREHRVFSSEMATWGWVRTQELRQGMCRHLPTGSEELLNWSWKGLPFRDLQTVCGRRHGSSGSLFTSGLGSGPPNPNHNV